MRPIHFHARITEDVYARAQKLHFLMGPAAWVLPLILIAVVLFRELRDDGAAADAAGIVSSIVMLALLFPILWWLLLRSFRQSYRKLEEMYRKMDGTLDDEGFRYVSEDGTLTFPWKNLKRAIFFASDFGLVYRTEGYFLLLDRSFFASDAEWKQVVGTVIKHLPVRFRHRARSLQALVEEPA